MATDSESRATSQLPDFITAVRRVPDYRGTGTSRIALRIKSGEIKGRVFLDGERMVKGDVSELLAKLFDLIPGFTPPPPGQNRELAMAILSSAVDSMVVLEGDGFHVVGNDVRYRCLVWRERPRWLDGAPKVPVIVEGQGSHTPAASGSLSDWNESIGVHLGGNPYLLITVCAALSAVLLPPLGQPIIALGLVGPSSQGKSTAQSVGQSVIQPGEPLLTPTATAKGLRALLAAHRHRPVFIQDMRQLETPGELVNLLFDLGNAGTRIVSTTDQKAAQSAAMACVLVASSERGLAELTVGRGRLDGGVGARYFELVLQGPHGAFHKLPPKMNAARFADALRSASKEYYGAVWDSWIEIIAANFKRIEARFIAKYEQSYQDLLKASKPKDAVTLRLMRGVALWGFTAEVARKFRLLPITREQISAAINLVADEYCTRQGVAGGGFVGAEIIKMVRSYIEQHPGKFPQLAPVSQFTARSIKGYRHAIKDRMVFLVPVSTFEELFGGRYGVREVVEALKQGGYLLVTKDSGYQILVRIPGTNGKRKRFYAIREEICFDAHG